MTAVMELHTLEISQRPRRTWAQFCNAWLASIVFLLGCVIMNSAQFAILLPLRLVPLDWAQKVYTEGIRYTKGSFGTLVVLMCQWFAPTKLVVTFEKSGQGKFTEDELRELVVRDSSGRVVGVNLPQRAVMIANHQVYADWWYAWCLTYYMGTYKDVFIVLKKSLKWVPHLGWGMQFFRFIFLARSWASDRIHLSSSLSWLGHVAETQDFPLTFMLYPEGTLVSKDTRPLSKKFADKIGIPDMQQTLLPRSLGLHYSLRSLAPRIPSLELIDITMAYPGIPPFGYGQSYYTLRSIFLDRVPPPAVHMHIRKFDVRKQVPIGDISASDAGVANGSLKAGATEVEIPKAEAEKFEEWLRALWREKDVLIGKYLVTGSLADDKAAEVEIPLQLRSRHEILHVCCFFLPFALAWAMFRMRW